MSQCQHCQEPLENKRRKNCEFCSDAKATAHGTGTYRDLMTLMDKLAADDSLTPAERRERISSALKSGEFTNYSAQHKAERIEREKERTQIKRERNALNARLREAGFVWKKYATGEDLFADDPPEAWYLYAPDGQEISKAKAVKIINGETTLEEVRDSEQAALDKSYQRDLEKWSQQKIKIAAELAKAQAAIDGLDEDVKNAVQVYRDGTRYDIRRIISVYQKDKDDEFGFNATFSAFFGNDEDMQETLTKDGYRVYLAAIALNSVKFYQDELSSHIHSIPRPEDYAIDYHPRRVILDGIDNLPEEYLASLGL